MKNLGIRRYGSQCVYKDKIVSCVAVELLLVCLVYPTTVEMCLGCQSSGKPITNSARAMDQGLQ